jgi:hypothetical protein
MQLRTVVEFSLKVLGVFFAVGAILVREDETRKVTDRLMEWWIRADDAQRESVSRTTAFLRTVSRLVTRLFDRIFGERIFSPRSVAVSLGTSVMFTCSSFFLFGAFADLRNEARALKTGSPFTDVLMSLGFAAIGTMPAFLKKGWQLLLWLLGVLVSCRIIVYIGYVLLRMRGLHTALTYFTGVAFIVMFSYVCDLFFITVTRVTFRELQRKHLMGIISMVFGNVILANLFIFGPVFLGVKLLTHSNHPLMAFFLLIGSPVVNSVDIAACGLAFAVSFFVVCYRYIFWPLVSRLLFRGTSLSTTEVRAVMWAIAGFLWGNHLLLKWIGLVKR